MTNKAILYEPNKIVSYKDIIDYKAGDTDKKTLKKITKMIEQTIKEIIIIEVIEDKKISEEDEKDIPDSIAHFLQFSERRGIKYYILKTKKDVLYMLVGVFGSSTGRANAHFMQQIIDQPKIQSITTQEKIAISELTKTHLSDKE